MQQIINIITTLILALITLFTALQTPLATWVYWILFIVAAIGLILSVYPKKK